MYKTHTSTGVHSSSLRFQFLMALFFLCLTQIAHAAAPAIQSATVPSDGSYGDAQNLDFTVTWDQSVDVTGTPYLTLTVSDATTRFANYVSGSGTATLTFRRILNGAEPDGAIAVADSISLNGGAIENAGTEAADLTSIPFGPTAAVLIDNTAPSVTSINRQNPVGASVNGLSVVYRVTFNEAVSGVGTSDFTLTTTSGVTTGTVFSINTVSATTYDVTVNVDMMSSDGTIRLDLNSSGTGITDAASNPIAAGYTSGQSYTIDTVQPLTSSINRLTPASASTNAASVIYRVTFTEHVSGVGTSDFELTATGGATGNIASVSATSGTTIDVTVDTITGEGTLRLDVAPSATIADDAGSGIGSDFTGGQTCTIDTTAPSVSSINRQTPAGATTNATSVVYRVTFDESVSGVDVTDFTLTPTGTAAGNVASVSAASGTTIDVTVDTITGDGTLRLDLNAAATGITDGATNDISGGFTSGQTYTIDTTGPSVSSINRQTPAGASTNATSVVYRVTFSEAVTGVDSSDFAVTPTGTAAGNVASVSAVSSTVYDITVDTISGDGTLRLDLNGAATGIADGATNAISGGYSSGQTYTIDNTAAVVTSVDVPASRSYIGSVCCLYFIIFDFMDFVVHFDSPVYVSGAGGSLYIDIDVGGVSKQATYTAGSGTSALTLHWAPEVGDVDTDGIGVGSMHVSGGIRLQDAAGNDVNLTLNSVGDTSGVLVDGIVPTVSSINRVEATPTSASTIHYTVTFSEDVLHVDASDFSLTATGTAAGTVASVNAVSASVYTVAVSGVSGDGTLRLDLNSVPSTGITDVPGNPIESNYTSGQTFTIDANAPTVSSINRAGSDPSTTVSVDYTVTFSETVTGVDASDFTLTHTGSANGTVATVTPVSGSIYTVTVNDIVGSGTLRLDLNSSGTGIADSASNAISAGYTAGQTYTTSESIDAQVSISANGGAGINGGSTNTYTITVVNNGPTTATNLGIGFTAPAQLTTTGTWSCVASAGTTCPHASGTYPIAESAASLPMGESLTYIVVGTVDAEAISTSITTTATISPSNLQHDLSHSDDTATLTDAIGVYANGFE